MVKRRRSEAVIGIITMTGEEVLIRLRRWWVEGPVNVTLDRDMA